MEPTPQNASDHFVHRFLTRLSRDRDLSMWEAKEIGECVRRKYGLAFRHDHSFEFQAWRDYRGFSKWRRGRVVNRFYKYQTEDALEEAKEEVGLGGFTIIAKRPCCNKYSELGWVPRRPYEYFVFGSLAVGGRPMCDECYRRAKIDGYLEIRRVREYWRKEHEYQETKRLIRQLEKAIRHGKH